MIDLRGRRVLVTGGSRGIGAACCRLFARAGAAVLVHYGRSEDAARRLAGEIAAEAPEGTPEPLVFGADVASAEAVGRLFGFIRERWGGLDCLVANAGVWTENRITRFDLERYEETMATNVRGVFLCMAQAVPLLAEGVDANVVTVTSTAAQRGEARHAPYAASKGALVSATKAWATELAPRVRVNSVAPGWVATDMTTEALAGEAGERAAAEIPLGRVASPEDVAGPVLFLASPLARHVTGEIVNVNGGSVLVG